MKHLVEVRRNFNKTDAKMLQQSDCLLGSFRDNKSLFIERFLNLPTRLTPNGMH